MLFPNSPHKYSWLLAMVFFPVAYFWGWSAGAVAGLAILAWALIFDPFPAAKADDSGRVAAKGLEER